MKIIKILVSLAVGLGAIFLIIAALAPKEYALEKEILINKNNREVFTYIKFLENQKHYSPWVKMDPAMNQTSSGEDGTVGFISAWESDHEKVGKGEQEITKIEEGKRLETELRFIEPFEATDSAYMTTESVSQEQTKVTWGFVGNVAYPMNILLLTVDMDKEVGALMEEGLNNLKNILEN